MALPVEMALKAGRRIERPANVSDPARAVPNLGAEFAIGRAVAAMGPDGARVFLSTGATLAPVASALARRKCLTVVTTSLDALAH